jgi:hypothetical protein
MSEHLVSNGHGVGRKPTSVGRRDAGGGGRDGDGEGGNGGHWRGGVRAEEGWRGGERQLGVSMAGYPLWWGEEGDN